MKKNIIYLVALLFLAFGFMSCDKESEGLTSITYYANIVLKGESTMYLAKGSTFTDPGFTATMAGEDVTSKVNVSNPVDANKSGVYKVSYSITNPDGFVASASRTVVVLDATDAVEGKWKVDKTKSKRVFNGTDGAYKDAFEILIIKRTDGNYDIEDLMGGWYYIGAGYGINYALQGVIAVADDGTISLKSSHLDGWGGGADSFTNGKFDATTSTISYVVVYKSGANTIEFDVELTKVDLGL